MLTAGFIPTRESLTRGQLQSVAHDPARSIVSRTHAAWRLQATRLGAASFAVALDDSAGLRRSKPGGGRETQERAAETRRRLCVQGLKRQFHKHRVEGGGHMWHEVATGQHGAESERLLWLHPASKWRGSDAGAGPSAAGTAFWGVKSTPRTGFRVRGPRRWTVRTCLLQGAV